MKKSKAKGCLKGCGITFVAIIVLFIGLGILGNIVSKAQIAESVCEEFFDDEIYTSIKEDAAQVFKSEKKTQQLEELVLQTLASSPLSTEQGDWDNLNEIYRLTKALQHMEYAEYRNENVRNAFKERFTNYLTDVLKDGNLKHIANICDDYFVMDYYYSPQDLLTKELFLSATENMRNEAFSSGDMNLIMSYISDIAYCLEKIPTLQFAEILPADTLIPLLTKDAEPIIVKDGQGGYYDDKKEEYDNHSGDVSALGVDVAKKHIIYSFSGDFMTKSSSVRYTRKNGTDLEESQLSRYDKSSSTIYYCGEEIQVNKDYFYKARGSETAYQKDGYFFVASDEKIVSFKGTHTFYINYISE